MKTLDETRQYAAARIAQLREARELTLVQLAELLGVTDACVSRWESAATFPRPHLLVALARVFGVSIDYLVRRENTEGGSASDDVINVARHQIATTLGIRPERVRITIVDEE